MAYPIWKDVIIHRVFVHPSASEGAETIQDGGWTTLTEGTDDTLRPIRP